MLLTILGAGILLSELDNIIQYFLPAPQWFLELFEMGGIGTISLIVIIAPLTEELVFRGLILRGFLTHYSVNKAIICSALLFGLIHLNPWQFPVATVAGLLFGWWYFKTGSLLPGIVGHALHNGIPFLLAWVSLEIPGYTIPGHFQPLWFNVMGAALVVAGLLLSISQFRSHAATLLTDSS